MSLHREINFEDEICDYLAAHGWLYAEGDAARYDRSRALFSEDVIAWIQSTQPKIWEALSKNHGVQAAEILLGRLRQELDTRGALDVLRHGFEMVGLRQPIQLAQFKPAHTLNADILARYDATYLRVVRQVRYSLHNENCIDLVLFLNGIPTATVELKTDFTQDIEDAVDQYRFDRLPKLKGHAAEPLLSFPSGALVHFAVSNSEARMTTKLEGPATRFLPFNQGSPDGGAGNPLNDRGHRTSYLWERIWERDSWLEILGRYLVTRKNSKKQIENIIFPRFHQLDATRKLVAAVLHEGPGGKYLIQHSAGSGKTNSIAWSAHLLADLHDTNNKKLFDSVLVVSDRTVIDAQLQEAIFEFERTLGVVATITGDSSSKSDELAKALSDNKKIITCTIQTFPYALKTVQKLALTQGKRFAVIADEAHSSQTGETATKLKAVLSAEELQELQDGGTYSIEDVLASQMSARAKNTGITFVAFTATPKAKTLELFGRRPHLDRPAGPDNLPAPFHVYSMRQAIEEHFILDVLKNYTPYKLAYKLTHDGIEYDEHQVEQSAAKKKIFRWVKLHPYNISQKVHIVVEHFRENVAPLLNGEAKAMVVVGSRAEAVRWKLEMDRYIQDRSYAIGTLVAFSGEIVDADLGPVSETSKALNPNLHGRDIREAFGTAEYQILLVANKFQTGFDQDMLCGMYVDKRLGGVQAVQTLSRLNRARVGKDTTYVLDFVNDVRQILDAFKTYHTTAELTDVTDLNLVFNLRAKLDKAGYYDDSEVNRVVATAMDPQAKQSDLMKTLEPVAERLVKRYRDIQNKFKAAKEAGRDGMAEEAQNELDAIVLFKSDMDSFQHMYIFLSQMFDYGSTALEKRHIFYKHLLPLLEFGREREGVDLSKVVLTHHKLQDEGKLNLPLGEGERITLDPLTELGSGAVHTKEKAALAEIIEQVNQLFDGNLSDDDKLIYVNHVIKGKLLESEVLKEQAINNTKEQFASSSDLIKGIEGAIMDALEVHSSMSKQALASERLRQGLKDVLLGPVQLYEALRSKATSAARSLHP